MKLNNQLLFGILNGKYLILDICNAYDSKMLEYNHECKSIINRDAI